MFSLYVWQNYSNKANNNICNLYVYTTGYRVRYCCRNSTSVV